MAEKKLKISTLGGQNETTLSVSGLLDGLVVESPATVNITIESEFGYTIFHMSNFKGSAYFAPRARTIAGDPELIDKPGFPQFNLNETIRVRVSGTVDKEISMILRFV